MQILNHSKSFKNFDIRLLHTIHLLLIFQNNEVITQLSKIYSRTFELANE